MAQPPTFEECAALHSAWYSYVDQHRACQDVYDCTIIGGSGTCNCGYTLGDGSGTAIAKSGAPGAKPYQELFAACVEAHLAGCVWDAAPAKNLRCENGMCTADSASCLTAPKLPDAGPDGDADADANADAGKPPTLAECNALPGVWSSYVDQHRACESVADCTIVGGSGTCGCGYTLGDGSGTAIAKSGASVAKSYLELYAACAEAHVLGCVWDAAPAKNLRCENGLCTADSASCSAPNEPDGAPDGDSDTGTDAAISD